MTCTCGQAASEYEDRLVRTATQEARHKGYNAGIQHERLRIMSIVIELQRTGCRCGNIDPETLLKRIKP